MTHERYLTDRSHSAQGLILFCTAYCYCCRCCEQCWSCLFDGAHAPCCSVSTSNAAAITPWEIQEQRNTTHSEACEHSVCTSGRNLECCNLAGRPCLYPQLWRSPYSCLTTLLGTASCRYEHASWQGHDVESVFSCTQFEHVFMLCISE